MYCAFQTIFVTENMAPKRKGPPPEPAKKKGRPARTPVPDKQTVAPPTTKETQGQQTAFSDTQVKMLAEAVFQHMVTAGMMPSKETADTETKEQSPTVPEAQLSTSQPAGTSQAPASSVQSALADLLGESRAESSQNTGNQFH